MPTAPPFPNISVVYLLWAPHGPSHVQRFAAAYQRHSAGISHNLVVAACGATDDDDLAAVLVPLASLAPQVEVFDGPRIDLQTYQEAVHRLPATDCFVFMNSYCEPLANGWVKLLADAAADDDVGIVGPGGSFESFSSSAPFPLGLLYLPAYSRFPNPHVRTSCFALSRSSIELVKWPVVTKKAQAHKLESGRNSISRQLQKLGRRPLVVGANGQRYEQSQWRDSQTFRSGQQQNLLVADLRSRDFDEADTERREYLARIAWER
ncbi:MAG: hypothetical protein JHC87_05345 [Thermoleophilaceae bacterium]|nr:hypothetical protein [Thermoleophilaceae bacterium]